MRPNAALSESQSRQASTSSGTGRVFRSDVAIHNLPGSRTSTALYRLAIGFYPEIAAVAHSDRKPMAAVNAMKFRGGALRNPAGFSAFAERSAVP
ncbi:MAG: hypothetical protein WDO73_32545 [Ignavibacteriota bacterium]